MASRTKTLCIAVALLTIVPATGCAKTRPPTIAPAKLGNVVVTAFAPAPPSGVSKLVVIARDIEVHLWGTKEGQWIKLIDAPPPFDLAVAGLQYGLVSKLIPVGDYTQVRLTIDKIVVTMEDKDGEMETPGYWDLFATPFGIVQGETTVIGFYFDVEKSVVITGADKVQFRPFVRLLVSREPAAYKTPTPTPTILPGARTPVSMLWLPDSG